MALVAGLQSHTGSWLLAAYGGNSLCTWPCLKLPPVHMPGLPKRTLGEGLWFLYACAPPDGDTAA